MFERSKVILLGVLAAVFVVSRYSSDIGPYYKQIILLIGINIILATSLNLVNGYTGQFSLGHAGFMSVGAYAAASLTIWGGPVLNFLKPLGSSVSASIIFVVGRLLHWMPLWFQSAYGLPILTRLAHLGPLIAVSAFFGLALLAGGLAAGVTGLLVGIPSLRLKGDYLAIVTLGFGEIIKVVIQNTETLGGARGLSVDSAYTSLFWVYATGALTVYVVLNLVNSTYGRGFLTVRDDEIAAEAMGINTTKYKVLAFTLAAFFAGIAGGLYAHLTQFINPEAFNFLKSVDIVTMVILGGMGSTGGVVIAAVLLTILPEWLRWLSERPFLPHWLGPLLENRMIPYSLLLILLMLTRPQGLFGGAGPEPKKA
jgi:branched-chain amino acid transport system permease protein